MNVISLMGTLGKDAVVRYTQNGSPVTDFSIAVNEGPKDKQITTWIDCTLWGLKGEQLDMRKGDLVKLQGKLRKSSWDDKTTGQKRYKSYVLVDLIEKVEKAKLVQSVANMSSQVPSQSAEFTADNIPF
jgi:single-strand DNA-binding protein